MISSTRRPKYNPHSPYSASKASSDHFVRAFHDTYGMPTIVTNCSNNYGPYQFPEKLIPLFINNIRHRKPLPIYGRGENVRDWLFVEDHARAIDLIFHKGTIAETYNIGGFNEWKNIDIIKMVINTVDRLLWSQGRVKPLISLPMLLTASVTMHVTLSIPLNFRENLVGSQVSNLRRASKRLFAGISTIRNGWTM